MLLARGHYLLLSSTPEAGLPEWLLIQDTGQVDENDENWAYDFKLTLKAWLLYIYAFVFLS